MPLLTTKIEGKGNGIKTVIPNMVDVARALSRPPTYPTKYFGCELGAQTTFDEKNERYIVNGAHNADRLRELLDGFIDKFVLCKSCKNPETDLVIVKQGRSEDIIRDCKACGERTGVDMRHKLTTFILRNPPIKVKKGKKKTGTGDAAAGVGGGGDHSPDGDDAELVENGAESDDELTRKIKAEAKDLTDETTLAKEDWSADTSPEAVKERIKALEGSMAGASLGGGDDDGSDDDANSPYSQLGKWVEEERDESDDSKTFIVAVYKKAEELGIEKKHKTVLVLVQALFTADVMEEIPKYAPLFAKVGALLPVHCILTNYRDIRWFPPRNIKSRFWEGSNASLASLILISSLPSPRSSWHCTKPTSLRKKSSRSGAPTSARNTSTRRLARKSERPASPS